MVRTLLLGPDSKPKRYSNPGGRQAFSSLVRFYAVRSLEREGLARLSPWFERLLALPDLSDSARAFFLNQTEMLLYGAGDYAKAIELTEQIRTLAPDDLTCPAIFGPAEA